MNTLPNDLINIIDDYKNQLEINDKKKKMHKEFFKKMKKRYFKTSYQRFTYYRCPSRYDEKSENFILECDFYDKRDLITDDSYDALHILYYGEMNYEDC